MNRDSIHSYIPKKLQPYIILNNGIGHPFLSFCFEGIFIATKSKRILTVLLSFATCLSAVDHKLTTTQAAQQGEL